MSARCPILTTPACSQQLRRRPCQAPHPLLKVRCFMLCSSSLLRSAARVSDPSHFASPGPLRWATFPFRPPFSNSTAPPLPAGQLGYLCVESRGYSGANDTSQTPYPTKQCQAMPLGTVGAQSRAACDAECWFPPSQKSGNLPHGEFVHRPYRAVLVNRSCGESAASVCSGNDG